MTAIQILRAVKQAGKPVCRMQLYRYFDRFKISPIGIRQRPQQYPDDSARRILAGLGLEPAGPALPVKTNGKILSLKQLKQERKKQNAP